MRRVAVSDVPIPYSRVLEQAQKAFLERADARFRQSEEAGEAKLKALLSPVGERLASYEKQDVLMHCVARFKERFDELAYALCIEAGKPIKDSEGEVSRLIDTFRIAAEESVRMTGEVQTMDISPRAKGYRGMWKRVPIGPCSFISPFNFPLNLAAHKIAPAIAMGCPFVMKPASKTPLGALIIGEVLADSRTLRGGGAAGTGGGFVRTWSCSTAGRSEAAPLMKRASSLAHWGAGSSYQAER